MSIIAARTENPGEATDARIWTAIRQAYNFVLGG
jgi:hypothetical protein